MELTGCVVDLDRGLVLPRSGASPIRLTTREAVLVRHLAERAPEAVSRDELLAKVWGYAESVVSRTCDVTVNRLRAKIELDPTAPDHLLTAYGSGYQLVPLSAPTVRPEAPPAPAAPDLVLGEVRIDLQRLRVDGPRGASTLTANEVALLRCFLRANGAVVERRALVRQVWGQLTDLGRRVDNAVFRLRSKIEADPGAPRYLLTAVRGGYQLVLEPAEPVEEALDAETLPRLPIPVDRWFGPPSRIDEVVAHLERDRLVTLTGPGGIGKSRLALAVGHQLEGAGRAVVWVAAMDARSVDALYTAVALAVGAPATGPASDGVRRLARFLDRQGPLVLVLDNLEQARDAAGLLGELLSIAEGLRILATSRVVLRTRGERVVSVEALDLADGVALFGDRAIRRPLPGEASEVEALVAALDGVPLAIELAATRTAVLSVAALRERARAPLRMLVSRDSGRAERHQSLRGSLDASHELLSAPAQRMLAQLAVFEGSFAYEAVEAVVELGSAAPFALDVLEELVDATLVRGHADGRSSLLVPVREYAAERLGAADRAAAELRHGQHYSAPIRDPDGPNEAALRATISADRADHLAAMERAIARGDGATAAGAFAAVRGLWMEAGPLSAVAEAAQRILVCALDDRSRIGMACALATAQTLMAGGDLDLAAEHVASARALAVEVGDPDLLYHVVDVLAVMANTRGDIEAFGELAREAYALSVRCVRPSVRCWGLVRLARAHEDEGDLIGASELLVEAERVVANARASLQTIVVRRQVKLAFNMGRIALAASLVEQLGQLAPDDPDQLLHKASILRVSGRSEEALPLTQRAAALHRRRGRRSAELESLIDIGWDHVQLGELQRARHAFLQGQALASAGERGQTLLGLACVAVEEGDLAEAEALAQASAGCARDLDQAMHARGMLGWVQTLGGRVEEAVRTLEAGIDGSPFVRMQAGLYLAEALTRQGRLDAALTRLDEALATAGELWVFAASALVSKVGILARLGRVEEARAIAADLADKPVSRSVSGRAAFHLATAELAVASGDHEAARVALDRASEAPAVHLGPRYVALRATT